MSSGTMLCLYLFKLGCILSSYTEACDTLETVIDYVRFACSEMNKAELHFGHGTDNAWDEALALVFYALSMPHELGPKIVNAKLVQSERQNILKLLDKRIQQQTPLPYLTNHSRYCDLDFYIDERVLIPRSPIAELIEQQFCPWVEPSNVNSILELCTGSGCLSIAMSYAFPESYITATDISSDALEVAAINVDSHGVEEHLQLIQSDVYDSVPDEKYDLIVSNPPYVCDDEMATLPEEYNQEPTLALRADDSGLAIADRILYGAHQRLNDDGILVVEVGNSGVFLEEKYPHVPFTWLEFERGGSGVFLLTKAQLVEHFS